MPFASLAGDDLDRPDVRPRPLPGAGRGVGGALVDDADRVARACPEERALAVGDARAWCGAAIDALPPMQAEVIRLRDVLGWSSEEVRNALDLTETNQRVLLHRARAKVRRALEREMETEEAS